MGKPTGLTRTAKMRTIMPLATLSIKRTANPRIPKTVPRTLKNHAEKRSAKLHNKIMIAKLAVMGANITLNNTLIKFLGERYKGSKQ